MAIKSALLINGGASVAILAFLGSFLSKGEQKTAVLNALSGPLLFFGLGVLSGAFGAGLGYLCQRFHLGGRDKAGFRLNVAAIIMVFLSYPSFLFGLYKTYSIFKNLHG